MYARQLWVTVLSLFYGSGIRRGELSRLNLAGWDSQEGVLHIDGRKTGRPRVVPVPELLWRCIESYLPHRQNQLERVGELPPVGAVAQVLLDAAIVGAQERHQRETGKELWLREDLGAAAMGIIRQ